jgi:hypothetical protein
MQTSDQITAAAISDRSARIRIAGVEDDLPGELDLEVAPDLRERLVGDRDQDDVAKLAASLGVPTRALGPSFFANGLSSSG